MSAPPIMGYEYKRETRFVLKKEVLKFAKNDLKRSWFS
jgi:hypothetical protein